MHVAVAGSGFMARTHVRAYRAMDRPVEIVGVAAPSGPEGFLADAGLEARAYTDVRNLLEDESVDCLDVCTPTHTHPALVELAAGAGVPVFLEKPVATTLEGARRVERAVEAAGVPCMVGHVVRFDPGYRRAREQAIGTPGVARARRLAPYPDWGSGDWFGDPAKSGGLFVDLAIHDLDYLRWCWGPIERVFARRTGTGPGAHGLVTLRFACGAVGTVEASWAQPDTRAFTTELELAGAAGVVEHEGVAPSAVRTWTADGARAEPALERSPHQRELEAFLSCLETGREPPVGPAAATASLRVALAAEQSATTGDPVAPAEVTP